MTESTSEESESGKNAAFFVALRENPTWRMSETLKHKPFLALNATAKAKILQFLCNELLQNKAVIRQVETAIETVAQLKRDRWTNDSKLRKWESLHIVLAYLIMPTLTNELTFSNVQAVCSIVPQ